MASGAADAPALALEQFEQADNMTDRQGALGILANSDTEERLTALAAFYDRYKGDPLVIDKWFMVQALSSRDDTLRAVQRLLAHPDFSLVNPNRLRSLLGAFGANQRALHAKSGEGYRFLANSILAVDKLNPQNAARMVPPLGRWRRFGPERQALMKAELERIVADPRPVEGRVRAGEQEFGVNAMASEPHRETPSPRRGEGWGEGARRPRIISSAEPPHPTLSPLGRGNDSVKRRGFV